MPDQYGYFTYELLRNIFLLGARIRPILDALDAQPGERVLDAGCGFGNLAMHFTHCHYTGVDSDPARIAWARRRYGESETRRFLVVDVTDTGLAADSFDKAVGYGLLHHLPDAQAARCLSELCRIVKGRIVFSDPVYSKWHGLNNLLCRMDQGDYVRGGEDYRRICLNYLTSKQERYFWARNGLARYYLSVWTPKEKTVSL